VTFYARVDAGVHTINVVGYGNDATGDVSLAVERPGVSVTTTWQRVVVPLPRAPGAALRGLFHFAEGGDEGAYALFIDDLRYTTLAAGVITNPRPAIATVTIARAIGETTTVAGQAITYAVQDNGAAAPVDFALSPVAPGYFTYASSDDDIASVNAAGVVTANAAGSATITASLGALSVAGALTVTVTAGITVPVTVAPTPVYPAADVIALFSSHYATVPVDTFRTVWSAADLADFAIEGTGRTVKRYTLRNFVGIETVANQIDAADANMTALSMAVWTPDISSLLVKVVDFGADGNFGGGDDREVVLTVPVPVQNAWTTIEVPFSGNPEFAAEHVAQVIIDGLVNAGNTLYVDDLILHR
jgi:hypothetical protein